MGLNATLGPNGWNVPPSHDGRVAFESDLAVPSLVDESGQPLPFAQFGGATAVIVGDSRTQQNYDQDAVSITGRPRWFTLGNGLARQKLKLIGNAGVNGDTAAGILARLKNNNVGAGFGAVGSQAASVTTAPGVIPFAPKYCIVNAGFNDIVTLGGTAAATMPTLISIYQLLLQYGITPVACSIAFPTFAVSTIAKQRELNILNSMIRAYAAATPGVEFVEMCNPMMSPASSNIESASTYFRDTGVHENNVGGYREGKALAAWINGAIPKAIDILPASNAETIAYDGAIAQVMANPLLTGTQAASGTGVSGNMPANLAITFARGGTPTLVCSVASRADGYGQDFIMEITAGAANDSFEARFPSQHANIVQGGTYVMVAELNVSGASGAALTSAANLRGMQLYIQYNDGATNFFTYELAYSATDQPYPESFTYVAQSRPMTIPASGTPTIFRPNFGGAFAGAGTARIAIGRLGIYRIG